MPNTTLNPPRRGNGAPSATVGDAVNYVQSNPTGVTYVVNAVKWVIGLVAALLKPAAKKP